jgi:hypothetical protein
VIDRHASLARRGRRGFMLLLVLGSLVVLTSAALLAARSRATDRLGERVLHAELDASELLDAAEGAAMHWLGSHAARTVLAVDAAIPGLVVLDETLRVERRERQVAITAFDQLGMLPWSEAQRSGSLRTGLPGAVRNALERAASGRSGELGLDLLLGDGGAEPAEVFPTAGLVTQEREDGGGIRREELPIGALVATHPRPGGTIPINPNTAPLELLEALLRSEQRDLLGAIRSAREEGRALRLGGPPPRAGAAGAGNEPPADAGVAGRGAAAPQRRAISLVGESDAWAFRIDARVEGLERSRWLVCRRIGGVWRVVQRLEIAP